MFPLTGYFPFLKGACGYRFFVNDAISFEKSLNVKIGFGVNEDPSFRQEFGQPGSTLQLSSVVYWYQTEPHAALPVMPQDGGSGAGAGSGVLARPREAALGRGFEEPGRAIADALRPAGEGESSTRSRASPRRPYPDTPGMAGVCRSITAARTTKNLRIELSVPKAAQGTVRLHVIDPDNFEGGRKEEVIVAGKSLGAVERFQDGRWLERVVNSEESAEGTIPIQARNLRARLQRRHLHHRMGWGEVIPFGVRLQAAKTCPTRVKGARDTD